MERKERRLAALNNHLTTQTLLDFDLDEESSDSDFLPPEQEDSDNEFNSDDDPDKSDGDSEGDDDDESSESDDLAGLLLGESSKKKSSKAIEDEQVSTNNLLELLETKTADEPTKALVHPKIPLKPICCVCLGDRSDDSNEIVECDNCGVTVHEGCYGITESNSISSTASSCSTEPWFCEACRADLTDLDCELCPNKGGVFKETDCGRWVHLVCALYVPGVAFGDVDSLSNVTLFEMQYNRWGAKTCSLCEDSRFAKTGVSIGCDAGMCKTYFHVTCAQAAGFLSETHFEEVDPFYAHCKLHSDKTLVRKRKRNYYTFKLQHEQCMREREQRKSEMNLAQQRIERKLKKHRGKYLSVKASKPEPWVPTQKMPRLLLSSASAVRTLIKKTELMGINAAAMEFEQAQIASLTEINKKWHIPPAFSVEFVGYYLDRTNRMEEIKKKLQEQITLNKRLTEEQHTLRDSYNEILKNNDTVTEKNFNLKTTIEKLHYQILALCPNKQLTVVDNIGKPVNVPKIASPPHSPPIPRRTAVPTAAALKMGVGFPLKNFASTLGGNEMNGRVLSTQASSSNSSRTVDGIVLNNCGICKKMNDQHLLAKCDTCKLYYHLGCLNPPLTRHPKKSKLYGWQCSECDKSDDDFKPEIIPKQPRRSRIRYSKDGQILPADFDESDFRSGSEMSKSGTNTPRQIKSPRKSDVMRNGSTNGPELEEVVKKVTKVRKRKSYTPNKISSQKRMSNVSSTTNELSLQEMPTSPKPLDLSKTTSTPTKKSPKLKINNLDKQKYVSELIAVSPSTSPTQTIPPNNILKKSPETPNSKKKTKNKKTLVNESPKSPPRIASPTRNVTKMSPTTLVPKNFSVESSPVIAAVSTSSTSVVMTNGNGSESSHKPKKKHKEKHRNKNGVDSETSTSKEHKVKRKRKKKHQEKTPVDATTISTTTTNEQNHISATLVEQPRIKIKFKAIPRPAGQPITDSMPQLFYVPTDSNDPPPVLTNNMLSRTNSSDSHEGVNLVSLPTSPIRTETNHITTTTTAKNKTPQRGIKRKSTSALETSSRKSLQLPANSSATVCEDVCDVCKEMGTAQNLVRCDECLKYYHFHCLDPPLKKSPKRRGYSWNCSDCYPSDVEKKK
ncbi:PHD finger protein 14 [Culicoides brevitarsis]|uniref:PHD finger protein 14 n=1 Tax=Culicoides brevitarsis TaxID=469753 RepID=UPI00307C50D9